MVGLSLIILNFDLKILMFAAPSLISHKQCQNRPGKNILLDPLVWRMKWRALERESCSLNQSRQCFPLEEVVAAELSHTFSCMFAKCALTSNPKPMWFAKRAVILYDPYHPLGDCLNQLGDCLNPLGDWLFSRLVFTQVLLMLVL